MVIPTTLETRYTFALVLAALVVLLTTTADGFTTTDRMGVASRTQQQRHTPRNSSHNTSLFYKSHTDGVDDFDDTADRSSSSSSTRTTLTQNSNRWASLNPRVKARIVKAGQERAIANKKKREPNQVKRRRIMMFVKEKQRQRKKASRVQRLLPFDQRTPLSDLIPGMEMTGQVISLTNFGAYVDVGTECDGLLHISQISRDVFVNHPRQVLTPGDEVTVQVRSVNPSRKKLHLTMLPGDVWKAEMEQQLRSRASDDGDADNAGDRIPLQEIQVDDELWGELRRVTDYGAYVEVGAAVDGWLHFMDHPEAACHVGGGGRDLQQRQAPNEQHPTDFMRVGDRVRVWVSDVDQEQQRIKLTALRPNHLPGPRRELF